MIHRTLGRTGFDVSALGLGGLQFTGWYGVSLPEADSILDYAIQNGINFIDTAQLYGGGESESIIARALDRHKNASLHVCEKFGHFQDGILGGCKDKGLHAYFDPDEMLRTIKHSMWVMRVDCFDILMIHEVEREWKTDFETGDSAAMTLLEELKKEGLVANIGVSSWDCSALAKVIKTGRVDAVMVAGGISLLNRWMFNELIPAAQEQNVGVIVGGALGQNTPGLVVKDRTALSTLKNSENENERITAGKLEALYDLSDELGLDMVQMAVRYVLSFPEIHTHTLGARSLEHIRNNIATAEMGSFTDDIVKRINAIQDEGETVGFKTFIDAHKQ